MLKKVKHGEKWVTLNLNGVGLERAMEFVDDIITAYEERGEKEYLTNEFMARTVRSANEGEDGYFIMVTRQPTHESVINKEK